MSAHTPGPWHVGGVSTPSGMEPYCNIWGPVPPGKQSGQMVAAEVAPEDAQLIAAAPDLFVALKALVADLDARRVPGVHFNDCAPKVETMTAVLAAIALAEGKR